MALHLAVLVLDLYDGAENPVITGTVVLSPNATVLDAADHLVISQSPVTVKLLGNPVPTIKIIATDNAGLTPPGWGWNIQALFPGAPPGRAYQIPYNGGATQYLSQLMPASAAPVITIPVTGTPSAGQVITATSPSAANWQTPLPPLSLDGNVADIRPPGTAAPGISPLAPHADHVHSSAGLVDTSTSQSVAGIKTFTTQVIVPAPVSPSDAVTKAYADALAGGLAVHPPVAVATTGALPAYTATSSTLTATSNGVLTPDGIAVALNDRVLVKNEAGGNAPNNGVFTCTTAGTSGVPYVLTRAADMNAGSEVPGAFCFVSSGTANGGDGFAVTGAGPFTLGSTAITWSQFSSAGQITAGQGISKSGTVISLGVPVTADHGGTGQTSLTPYAPLAGGTTGTGALQQAATGMSASGAVLTSNGASALPTWQALPASSLATLTDANGGIWLLTVSPSGVLGTLPVLEDESAGEILDQLGGPIE